MKIFKKISAIAASALMIGMTAGIAAAAQNYPNPFVVGGAADVAIVYGTGTGVSSLDLVQAGNIQSNLQSYMTGTTSTTATVSGEAAALFTGGTKLYINDSLNTVKNVLTDTELPTVLKDGSFSGNVDVTISQKIDLGSNPKVQFKKQPTSEDDPNYALTTSTTQANYIYNATTTFSKAVAFNHSDSEGEDVTLFGMDFTISSSTDADTLVLLKSAEKVSLTSDAPTADVTIAGETYTVELISASDTAATIQITDSTGASGSKEINEAASKKIQGVTVAVITADETNLKLSATVVVGSEKITLEDGSAVAVGEESTSVDGTLIDFGTGTPTNLTTLTISVYAPESDKDAIKPGEAFIDPVYGTFKLDFSGLNIATDSTSRETIYIDPVSDDKMSIKFTDSRGYEKTVNWARDVAGVVVAGGASIAGRNPGKLMIDDEGKNITVMERHLVHKSEYLVVGNEDEGRLIKVSQVKNSSNTGSSNTDGDQLEFTDVFSGELYKTSWTSDGVGNVPSIGGKTYNVRMYGASGISDISYNVSLDYPDSAGDAIGIVYPTIETSKGAKVAFYEPIHINYSDWDQRNYSTQYAPYNLTTLRTPDGDGYTDIFTLAWGNTSYADTATPAFHATKWAEVNVTNTAGNVLWMDTGSNANTNATNSTSGGLTFTLVNGRYGSDANGSMTLYLLEPDGAGYINQSALIVWEEKDDNTNYKAVIMQLENGRTGDDGLGVDASASGPTWGNNSANWRSTRYSNSKITDAADLWGTIITFDSGDSDQPTASISYPDEQIYAQLYMAAKESTITGGGVTAGTQLGEVLVKDSEVSSVDDKNLVVVGGSCINSVAANLVGGAYCGSAWTDATGVGSGEFLIQSFGDAYTTDKIALLVAGYEAVETGYAAKYLTTQVVDTTADKKYKGTSSTSAELVTEETTE